MKILIIPSWYPTTRNRNAGIFTRNQAVLLKKYNVETEVLFFDLDIRNIVELFPKTSNITSHIDEGVPTYIVKGIFPPKRNLWISKKWAKFCLNIFEQLYKSKKFPDIIHAHSYFAGAIALEISNKFKIPYLVTEHYSGFSNDTVLKWQNELCTQVFKNANSVICVSINLKKIVDINFGVSSIYLPNTVDSLKFYPKISDQKRDKSVIVGTYIGGLIKRKGLDKLVQTFIELLSVEKLPLQLIVIGEGNLKKELETLIAKNELSQRIKILGYQTNEQVAEHLRNSDFLILPSKAENAPVSIIEAIMTGLPVISSNLPWAHEIIDQNNGILVEPNNISSLKNGIKLMCKTLNSFDNGKISSNAMHRFSDTQNINKLIDIYEKIYKQG